MTVMNPIFFYRLGSILRKSLIRDETTVIFGRK